MIETDIFPGRRLLIQTARLGLYILIVLLALMLHLGQEGFFNWELSRQFYSIALIGILIHLAGLFLQNFFFQNSRLVFASFVLDIALMAVLSYRTELSQSLFLFLFLAFIILSGLVFQRRGAFWIAAWASLCFSLVSFLGPELKTLNFFFVVVLNNVAFFAAAWLSGYLSEQIETQGLSLQFLRNLNSLIVDTIPSGLITVTEEGKILHANLGARTLIARDDLDDQSLESISPELQKLYESARESKKMERQQEVPFHRGSDNLILAAQIFPQIQGNFKSYLLIFDDLTQVRRLEFAVRQSEKMAAVGQLAAGIAHEIRNPLAGISGSVELLSSHGSPEEKQKLSKIILREIDRLNRLISEFLDFAKPEKVPLDTVSLPQLFQELIAVLARDTSLRPDVEVHLRSSDVPTIRGTLDKLRQAFLNILINSYQAMVETPSPRLDISVGLKDEKVEVRIQDNGVGMAEETKKRMFEPFHTTKPKGTGLGLAITHKILEVHGAQVQVESSPGQGTCFVVRFPLVR